MTRACEMCAGPPAPGHRYCEACGRDLRGEDGMAWRSSTAPPGPCPACGGEELSAEGYCEHCGRRRGVGQDHVELALGALAAVTDKGQRKRHNEDAVAIGRIGGEVSVAVVCDGVSSSDRADEAAHAGVDTAVAALLSALDTGRPAAEATAAAGQAAAAAVAGLGDPRNEGASPSCTYVSAVVAGGEVVVGWVGDSRAYWLADRPADSQRLTTDDSLAAQLAAAGELPAGDGDARPADPRLSALARWLGADATDTEPRVVSFQPTGPGRVLLCSDGLSRYLSDPAELAVTAPGTPMETARALNQLSLDAGGVDNIAIVIIPVPPREGP